MFFNPGGDYAHLQFVRATLAAVLGCGSPWLGIGQPQRLPIQQRYRLRQLLVRQRVRG